MRRLLLTVLATAALLYGGLVLLLYTQQRAMIFVRPPAVPVEPEAPAKLVRIPAEAGGPQVLGYFLPPPEGAPTVFFIHGNGDQLAWVKGFAHTVHREGFGFFALEYPGYGEAPGEATEASLYAAAARAIDHLTTRLGVAPDRVVLFGQSLGSGVATELAHRGHGRRLVLLTPFTSLPDVAAGRFPIVPVRLLMKDRFDNAAKAPQITVPVLIVHGTADEVIPYAFGERLSKRFPNAQLHTVRGAGHNDALEHAGALERVLTFMR